MAQVQTPIFLFLALLLSTINIRTSLVYAIRSHHQKQSSGTSVLSMSLHPRHSIIKGQGQHRNYTALAISKLAGDKARSKYINSRLRNALFSSDPNFQAEVIESPVTRVGGGYVARVGVGQPASEFYLLADTGSEVVWLQCSPCSSQYCSQQIFKPATSSSYQPLSCASPQCNALPTQSNQCGEASTDSGCSYRVDYGDHSFATGEFATETLSFDGSGSVNNMAIGCAHEVEGKNMGQFVGILGLGPNPVSFASQIKATSFSYCLVDANSKSSSTLDFNSAAPADSVEVRMLRNPSIDIYYYVELTGITVGEDQIPVPDSVYQIGSEGMGGVIVDSGTTLTLLDPQVYGSVRDAFQKNAQNLAPYQANVEGFDTCYDVPSGSSASGLPAMSFQFSGGKSLPMGPENYFIRAGDSTFCLAFQPTNQPVSIIGNIHQHGMRVTYDLENRLIGFSPNKC